MESQRSIVCKLGGHEDSSLEIIATYPHFEISENEAKALILKCFPIGSKEGDTFKNKYEKAKILSYIFKVGENLEKRPDLFSISLLIDKKAEEEVYETLLKDLIKDLEEKDLLSEKTLTSNQKIIYEGIKNEEDIQIDGKTIGLSKMFEELRKNLDTNKNRKIKGSFF
jgi:hypothetical protein